MKPTSLIIAALCHCMNSYAQLPTFSIALGSPLTTSPNIRCVVATDLNGDSKQDLVVSNGYGNNIYMFNGSGNGQFTVSMFQYPCPKAGR